MTDRHPDFVIVGATKSATTWLHRNLQQHSAVFMPGIETHYFSRCFERGPAWYAAFFAPAEAHQLVGEKSTSYLEHPDAAARLRDALPELRVIIQLRNPIDRVWAHYCTDFRHRAAGADLGGTELERLSAGALCHRHVARFFELFGRERLCITLYDDLDRDPASVLQRIRAHVGLGGAAAAGAPGQGEAAEPGEPRGTAGRRARQPRLNNMLQARLRGYFERDVQALSELTGRDLSFWLGPTGAPA